ncbi:hypothetical protein Acr_13g0016740 [Actinidia rufa]|uniref:Uncharacterized protein n=1 Tax=Actinidia rufa TaxID=165716 RepID=A0A7J0FNI6_9ERIC|nr:hypothetical protein Acr_13g0016740 [Actinidia rufa]
MVAAQIRHPWQEGKMTLLKEYEQSGNSSVFIDKRIGEQNEGLGEFDKTIMRSQHEPKILSCLTILDLMDRKSNRSAPVLMDPAPMNKSRKESIKLDDVRTRSWLDSMKSSSLTHRKIAKCSGTELLSSDADVAYRNWMLKYPSVLSSFEHITNYAKGKRLALYPLFRLTLVPPPPTPTPSFSSGETIQHILGWKDEGNALKMNARKALVNKSISNEFVKKDVVFVPHNEDTLQQAARIAIKQYIDSTFSHLLHDISENLMITSSCFLERLIRLVKIKVSQREQNQKEEHRKTVLSGLVLVLAQLSVFIEQGGIPRITEEERQKRMLAPDDSSDDDGNGSEDVDNAQRLRSISGVILVIPSLMMKTRALKETDANLVHWALLYVDLWGTKNCIYRGKITQMREMENEKTAAEQRPWEQQNHCPSPSFRLPHPLPCLNIG